MAFPVKYFHNGMTGAPALSGTAGTMVNIIKACLITGFNTKTLNSLIVASNVATATISAGGHGFAVGDIIQVAGASPTELNGDFKVTAVTNTTVLFATTGITDQTATGTITICYSPIGTWAEQFSGTTNKLVVRSGDVAGSRAYFQFDDTATLATGCRMFETMSDIATGTQQCPSSTAEAAVYGIIKSHVADSSTRNWWLIGDGRTFYIGIAHRASNYWACYYFGDIVSYKAGDTKHAMIRCFTNTSAYGAATYNSSPGSVTPYMRPYIQRSMSGAGLGDAFSIATLFGNWGMQSLATFPSLSDNGVHTSEVYAMDSNSASNGAYQVRGRLPGIHACHEYLAGTHLETVTQSGVDYIALASQGSDETNASKNYFKLAAWR